MDLILPRQIALAHPKGLLFVKWFLNEPLVRMLRYNFGVVSYKYMYIHTRRSMHCLGMYADDLEPVSLLMYL